MAAVPAAQGAAWEEESWAGPGPKPLTRPGEAMDVKRRRLDRMLGSMPAVMAAAQEADDFARYAPAPEHT